MHDDEAIADERLGVDAGDYVEEVEAPVNLAFALGVISAVRLIEATALIVRAPWGGCLPYGAEPQLVSGKTKKSVIAAY